MYKIDLSKTLSSERWGEFFDRFSVSNRGRHIAIEIIDPDLGDQELIKNAPLLAMIYDRPDKGDNLAIEVGKDQMTYAHTVQSPRDISTGQNASGDIVAIWITDVTDRKTLIKLEV